jgi:hypothetical protein
MPFSGDDNSKLCDFLYECNLVFSMKPRTFATEKSHVLYALQYLDGSAKRHFRCNIEQQSTDPKVNCWKPFIHELETVFGNPDRRSKAAKRLLALKMKDNGKVHRFTIQFKEAADEVSWEGDILHHLYYEGLALRIKDIWAQYGPPSSFNDLVNQAHLIDLRHWEHLDEKKTEGTTDHSSDQKSQSKTSTSTSQSSKPKPTSTSQSHSSAPAPSTSSSTHSKPTPAADTKDLSSILGPNSKLLPEEKARHEKLGLCTYCGKDHSTDQCPTKPAGSSDKLATPSKSTSSSSNGSKPKGRVAQVVDPVADSDTGDAADMDF